MKVFKYRLMGVGIDSVVEMPEGSRIICVDIQGLIITLWALVDPIAQIEKRIFVTIGTGGTVPDRGVYIGTCFQRTPTSMFPNGFVWHIFEVVK